ncbi:hypothetical protein Tco_1029312 [Tanacetum coccineum]|uniref:CCHC-type domain-containing protein n=1 Tax=Tanacetum coccineum TaxID=301880 RepID=A0ABQ5G3A4_9ASTR
MKDDEQAKSDDLPVWISLMYKFYKPVAPIKHCRVDDVRTRDQEDHNDDDNHPEGESSTQEQLEDFDAWQDDQGIDNDDENAKCSDCYDEKSIQAENKRKLDNNNQTQQQLSKRQNVAQAYAAGTGERKEYAGTLPLCNKCKFHHNGPCTVKCANCKRVGHLTRDCWSSAATNNQRTLTCYECGNQGHYRSDCPELKNRNHGNQAEGTEARGMVYALEGGDTDQDLNNIEDEIEA